VRVRVCRCMCVRVRRYVRFIVQWDCMCVCARRTELSSSRPESIALESSTSKAGASTKTCASICTLAGALANTPAMPMFRTCMCACLGACVRVCARVSAHVRACAYLVAFYGSVWLCVCGWKTDQVISFTERFQGKTADRRHVTGRSTGNSGDGSIYYPGRPVNQILRVNLHVGHGVRRRAILHIQE
jgi:hypothetical protein